MIVHRGSLLHRPANTANRTSPPHTLHSVLSIYCNFYIFVVSTFRSFILGGPFTTYKRISLFYITTTSDGSNNMGFFILFGWLCICDHRFGTRKWKMTSDRSVADHRGAAGTRRLCGLGRRARHISTTFPFLCRVSSLLSGLIVRRAQSRTLSCQRSLYVQLPSLPFNI